MGIRSYNWVDAHWNVFRYLGDLSHIISINLLLYKMLSKGSAHGISGKTQVCYLIVFCTRYLNNTFLNPPLYHIAFKVLFIVSSALIVILMYASYRGESVHNTFRIIVIFIISVTLSAFTMPHRSVVHFASTFSLWVEAFAIIPQMLLLARSIRLDILNGQYIFFLSVYRVFHVMDWVYSLAQSGKRTPKVLCITGILQTVIYSDFIWKYIAAWAKGSEFEIVPGSPLA
jgi:ER lumen protein retaining receptor